MILLLPALLSVLAVGRFDDPPLRDQPEPFDPQAVITEFGKSCKPPSSGPRCAVLRRQMEAVYLSDLLERRAAGEKLDPALYRAALNAQNPLLVVLGLRGLAKTQSLTAAEIARGIEDPRLAVRATAVRFAERSIAAPVDNRQDPGAISDSEAWLRGARDPAPTPADLGAAVYPGSKLRYFATGPRRWFFTTTDPPEKVVAFYTKGGKKVVTVAELQKAANEKPDMAVLMAAAQKDPQVIMREMQYAITLPRIDWTGGLEGHEGVVDPRYVVVAETRSFGRMVPTAVVMVFKDELLGATAVVFARSTQGRVDPPDLSGSPSKE